MEPLTKREAKQSREILIRSIQKYAELADDAIPLASKTGAPAYIWSTIDEKEAAVLADCLIDLGLRWAAVAQVVRGVVRAYTWLEVGMITIPRFRQTVQYYIREGFSIRLGFKLGR